MIEALKELCGYALMKSTPGKKGEIDQKFNTTKGKQALLLPRLSIISIGEENSKYFS